MANTQNLDAVPVPLQGVPAPGYNALDLRRRMIGQVQEGVSVFGLTTGDFKVAQRAAGAGLGVDVAAGEALVQGDSLSQQGLYYCLLSAALTAATQIDIAAGGAQPRVDQVVLEVKDTQHDGSGLNVGRVRVVQGTETPGATLDNRLGAAALPTSAIRLADVLVAAGAVQVATANIRDRRPWARGAYRHIDKPASASTASGGMVAIDAATFLRRYEFSGGPVRAILHGQISQSSNTAFGEVGMLLDGVAFAAARSRGGNSGGGAERILQNPLTLVDFVPSVGSHTLEPMFGGVNGGVATLEPNSGFTVEEIVRQNADNS